MEACDIYVFVVVFMGLVADTPLAVSYLKKIIDLSW